MELHIASKLSRQYSLEIVTSLIAVVVAHYSTYITKKGVQILFKVRTVCFD
jgi:hypothetical protein